MIRILAICMLAVTALIPCGAQVSVDSRRPDVILLTAPGPNDSVERAAGMYVGHDASNAFFITAAHALAHAQLGQVQVTIYGSPVPITAGIVEQKDDGFLTSLWFTSRLACYPEASRGRDRGNPPTVLAFELSVTQPRAAGRPGPALSKMKSPPRITPNGLVAVLTLPWRKAFPAAPHSTTPRTL